MTQGTQVALVTGANGFIGSHVARRLAEEQGMHVRALVRNPQGRSVLPLAHAQIEIVQGDLLQPHSLAAASDGVNLVVHTAMSTRLTRRSQVWATGVQGTQHLYAAARAAGAARFIFLSTFSVYFGVSRAPFDEQTPLVPCGDPYADAKIRAEADLLGAPGGGPVPAIVRPPLVYGPGSWFWSLRFLEAARQGRLFLPGGGEFGVAYTYIDNLVDAILALAQTDRCGVYNVFDGYTSYRNLVAPYAYWAGTTPRPLPLWAFRSLAACVEGALRLAGFWVASSRLSAEFVLWMQQWGPRKASKAHDELGWHPRVDLEEGMRRTELWLRQTGYLPPRREGSREVERRGQQPGP